MSGSTGAAVVLSAGPEVVPQWKKDLIARLKSQNKRFGYEIQQQQKDGSTLFGRTIVPQPNHHQHPLHHHQCQLKQRQNHQLAADEQVQAPVVAVSSSAPVPVVPLLQCKCREQCNFVNKMVQVYSSNSEHFDDFYRRSGSEEYDGEEEDLKYGPGIVSKLKNKYLSLAQRQSAASSRPTILRKATSLENLLDDDDHVDNGTEVVPKPHIPEPYLKRAKSVETISVSGALFEPEVQKPKRESYHEDMLSNRYVQQNKYQRPLNRPKRIAPLLNDKEKPPADLVKQTKRIFEKNQPQKYRKSSPTAGGVVAEKVDAFNSIIGSTKAKKPPIKQKPQDKLIRSRKIIKSDNRMKINGNINKTEPKLFENITESNNYHNELISTNHHPKSNSYNVINSEIIKNGSNHDAKSVSEAVNFNNKANNEIKAFKTNETVNSLKDNTSNVVKDLSNASQNGDLTIREKSNLVKEKSSSVKGRPNSLKDPSPVKELPAKELTSPIKDLTSPVKNLTSPIKEKSSPIKERPNSLKDCPSPVKELTSPIKETSIKSSQNLHHKSSLEDSKTIKNNKLINPPADDSAKLNISVPPENKVPLPQTLTESIISPIPDVSNSSKKPPEVLRLLASETPDLILTSSPITTNNHQSNRSNTQDVIKSTETFLSAELNNKNTPKSVKPVALNFANDPTANSSSTNSKNLSKTAVATGNKANNVSKTSNVSNSNNSTNVVNGDGLITVPKKSRSGSDSSSNNNSSSGGNTFLFNFTDRKDVPDYISNDKSRSPASPARPELPKAGEGGIILLPGATIINSYVDEEEEEIMRSLEAPPSPCNVTFINDNVLIDGKSSLSQKTKRSKMRISFVTAGPEIFEYPSETSLLLDDLPPSPVGGANGQLGHTVPNLVGSSLANYTPKGSIPQDFQPGITRTIEIEPVKVTETKNSDMLSKNQELYEEQDNPVLFSAGTNSDILF